MSDPIAEARREAMEQAERCARIPTARACERGVAAAILRFAAAQVREFGCVHPDCTYDYRRANPGAHAPYCAITRAAALAAAADEMEEIR